MAVGSCYAFNLAFISPFEFIKCTRVFCMFKCFGRVGRKVMEGSRACGPFLYLLHAHTSFGCFVTNVSPFMTLLRVHFLQPRPSHNKTPIPHLQSYITGKHPKPPTLHQLHRLLPSQSPTPNLISTFNHPSNAIPRCHYQPTHPAATAAIDP